MPSPLFADLSNNNDFYDPRSYAENGHALIALKASEGTGFADPKHRFWAIHSGLHGIKVAHYHFARPDLSSGADEAAWFLHVTAGLRGPHDYLVYDGERASNGAFGLDVAHCRDFDAHIRANTRFHTILYASASMLGGAGDALGNSPVKRCWDANYSSQADTHPPGFECVMRQFTDGVLGPEPHSLPGVGQADVNIMRGSLLKEVFTRHVPVHVHPPHHPPAHHPTCTCQVHGA